MRLISQRVDERRKAIIKSLLDRGITHDKHGEEIENLSLLDLIILKKDDEK